MQIHRPLLGWFVPLLTTLFLGEIAARLVFPLPQLQGLDRAAYSPQEVSPHLSSARSLANASFEFQSEPDDARSVHELNLNGFRDRSWDAEDLGNASIVFVGDSLTEGFLAQEDFTIPRVFSQRVSQMGLRAPVLNFGIGAAGLKEYLALMNDSVPLIGPRAVILVLYANDLIGPQDYRQEYLKQRSSPTLATGFRLRLVDVMMDISRGKPVARRWHAAPFPFFAPVPSKTNPWTDRQESYAGEVDSDIADAMRGGRFNPFVVCEAKVYAEYLPIPLDMAPWVKAFKSITSASRAKLMIVYVPYASQTTDHYLQFKRRFCRSGAPSVLEPRFQAGVTELRKAAEIMNVPFLDLTAAIRNEERDGNHLYWNYDEHMRPNGYAFVGQSIANWFIARESPLR